MQEIDDNYQPLDWQRDFKSGFRYDAKQWFLSQRKIMPLAKGVDLKVPWELSRLQTFTKTGINSFKFGEKKQGSPKLHFMSVIGFCNG